MTINAASDASFPVQLEVQRPKEYDRVQLAIRFLVCLSVGVLHVSLGGALAMLYVLLPTVAAILISQRGSQAYMEREASRIVKVLEWVLAFYAYLLFVTDRFPLDDAAREVRLRVTTSGTPALADAVTRLLSTLPHLLVLAVLAIASGCVALASMACILVGSGMPDALYRFQRSFLLWLARVLSYHAALIDVYPPFSLGGAEQQGTEASH